MFDNHLRIKIDIKNPDIVELEFSDKEYALVLEKINLSKLKLRQEQEAKLKQEQEAKLKLRQEQEAKLKQEQEAKLKLRQEQEVKLKQEQEAKLKQEQEAKLKQEHEAKLRQEQEAKLKQEQEAKLKQELEAKLKQEQEAKKPLQPIPYDTETQQIDENVDREKIPVEISFTELMSEENKNKELRTNCPKCKLQINSEAKFCQNCGTPLK